MMLIDTNGQLKPIAEPELLACIDRLEGAGVAPFSGSTIDVLAKLSAALLTSPEAKPHPQFIALGFWLRPANLQRMKKRFETDQPDDAIATCRGIALHLPPRNVDTIFVYSWALSVLAGNTNIVRLPSEISPAVALLCRLIAQALSDDGQSERQIFCTFDHNTGLSAKISAHCDLRMTWGGDEKVRAVSAEPLRPDGLSIGFPDRKSFSVIASTAYGALAATGRDSLAEKLFNDIFWFDQLGCGSPRIVVWIGSAGSLSDDLYERIAHIARRKGQHLEAGTAVSKFSYMNAMIAGGTAISGKRFGSDLDVLRAELNPQLVNQSHGGGLINSVEIQDLVQVASIVGRATQTITHFGFHHDTLKAFARSLIGKGGFRIVPIGEALTFEPVWDGIPLISHMTRQIACR